MSHIVTDVRRIGPARPRARLHANPSAVNALSIMVLICPSYSSLILSSIRSLLSQYICWNSANRKASSPQMTLALRRRNSRT